MSKWALKLISYLTVYLAGITISLAQTSPVTAIFPKGEGRNQEASYTYQLLKLALEKSNQPFELKLSDQLMPEARARSLISKNSKLVTVAFSGTSRKFEQALNPIRIPVYGGLLGHRLFLIHKDNIPNFAEVKDLADLKTYISGQGTNWSDVEILEASGLKVHTTKYHLLFGLLGKKRIHYFPRGATEIFGELEQFQPDHPHLTIEPSIVMVYPFASFFFVSNDNTALHDAIYNGMVNAHKDGSYHEFFRSHPSTANILKQANLEKRTRIDIANPLMTKETLAIDKAYWFDNSWAK